MANLPSPSELEKLQAENKELRRMLCTASHPLAYMDDGEAQDNSATPYIDYIRDSLEDIKKKRRQRAINVSYSGMSLL